jgi:hypothetical protein
VVAAANIQGTAQSTPPFRAINPAPKPDHHANEKKATGDSEREPSTVVDNDHSRGNYTYRETQERPKWYRTINWSNWAVVLVALFTGVAVWKQAQETASAAKATRDSAEEARKSNDISRANLVSVQRAFVSMKQIEVRRVTVNGVFEWRISARWENSGATPTKGLRLHVNFLTQPTPLPKGYNFPDIGEHRDIPFVLGPHAVTVSVPLPVPTAALIEFQQGTRHLYFWGRAVYRDVFRDTPQHVTKFCSELTGIFGDLQGPTELIVFQFAAHDEHNCADEDCDEESVT